MEDGIWYSYDSNDLVTGFAFAYCDNNPINYVDYDEHSATLTYYCLALVFVGFFALYAFFIASNFISSWQSYHSPNYGRLVSKLREIGTYITTSIANAAGSAASDVSLYVANKVKAYAAGSRNGRGYHAVASSLNEIRVFLLALSAGSPF